MEANKEEVAEKVETNVPVRQLYRLPKAGKVAGVCAGIANYLAVDVTVLRIIFIVLTIASGGFGILLYFILALIMPESHDASAPYPQNDLGKNINALTSELQENGSILRLRNFFGVIVALFGVWLLLGQLFPGWPYFNWSVLWPIILILLGGLIIYRRS